MDSPGVFVCVGRRCDLRGCCDSTRRVRSVKCVASVRRGFAVVCAASRSGACVPTCVVFFNVVVSIHA